MPSYIRRLDASHPASTASNSRPSPGISQPSSGSSTRNLARLALAACCLDSGLSFLPGLLENLFKQKEEGWASATSPSQIHAPSRARPTTLRAMVLPSVQTFGRTNPEDGL